MRVPGYEVLGVVGRGGHAVVHRARQLAFDRVVALKVVSGVDVDGSVQRRFERECKAAGALSWHPHIVAVHDAGVTEEGSPYLAMEFLEDGSLADRVRHSGTMDAASVASVAVQLCGALESAHRAGTLHRDVKPENVLVGPYGDVKLADFGIAVLQAATTVTATGTVTATVAHAAPEVLSGNSATPASDVYSLGSTLFALLAGKPAFVEPTDEVLAAALMRIMTSPVPNLREHGVPDELAFLVERAMAKEPAERPLSAAAFGEALQGFQRQAGDPVTDMRLREDRHVTVRVDEPPPRPPDVTTEPRTRGQGSPWAPNGSSPRTPPVDSGHAVRRRRNRWLVLSIAAAALVGLSATTAVVVSGNNAGGGKEAGDRAGTDGGPASVLWSAPSDAVESLSAGPGLVYGGTQDAIRALDVDSGSERWQFEDRGIGVIEEVVVEGDLAYAMTNSANIYALDADTGAEVWRSEDNEIRSWVGADLAVSNGVVYAAGGPARVYAADAKTGATLWEYGTESSTAGIAVVDGVVYTVDFDSVYALQAASGTEIWRFSEGERDEAGRFFANVSVANGVAYVPSGLGLVYALDGGSGKELWRFRTGEAVTEAPFVAESAVYVGSQDGTIFALDARTGAEFWRFSTQGGPVNAPIVSEGVLYAAADDVYALDPASGTELRRYTVPASHAPPLPGEGALFVGTRLGVYAVRR